MNSKNMQKLKISIQGGKGSYSHIAADKLFGAKLELIENDTFEEAMLKCKSGECDFGVIPFENSTHGSVIENYDLITKYKLYILKEIYLKINFHVLVNTGVKFEAVRNIYTHRVSLSQIKKFLKANPQIKPHEYVDNGKAAEFVNREGLKDSAAAASKLAGELFGLQVVKEKIQDNPKNYTRFFVISPQSNYDKFTDKTSISFIVKHEIGTLVKVLKCFSDEGISLTKIESRPIIGTEWEYLFYVDLLAGYTSKSMESAIQKAKKNTLEFNILGSYKQGNYIET